MWKMPSRCSSGAGRTYPKWVPGMSIAAYIKKFIEANHYVETKPK
jgi:hypothetical protein